MAIPQTDNTEFDNRKKFEAVFGLTLFIVGGLTAIDVPSSKDLLQLCAFLIALVGYNMLREALMVVIPEVNNFLLSILCVFGAGLAFATINNGQQDAFLQILTVILTLVWAAMGLFVHFVRPWVDGHPEVFPRGGEEEEEAEAAA